MIALAAEDVIDLRRWAISGMIVICAHAAIAAAIVTWREHGEQPLPAAAIVVDFAPLSVAPAQVPTELPPGPEQVMSDASPDRPVESFEDKPDQKPLEMAQAKIETPLEERVARKPVEEPPPEVPPAPDPEVAVEPPPPKEVTQETPQPQVPRPPAPATTAPQAIPERIAPVAAAPTQGALTRSASSALPTWKIQVAGLLERNKRYPPQAQSRREQGVVQLSFSLDRSGRLVASRVATSSGSAALDEEAMALVRRAQPFPPPPAELAGAQVDLTVPIRFNLR